MVRHDQLQTGKYPGSVFCAGSDKQPGFSGILGRLSERSGLYPFTARECFGSGVIRYADTTGRIIRAGFRSAIGK